MKSIIQTKQECFVCKSTYCLECHHIFGGPLRKWSEKYGLTVNLCHEHHNEPPDGMHHNKENREWLCRIGQKAFEAIYGHDEYMRIFKRNYL